MIKLQVKQIVILPILVGLMISMGINGYLMVQGQDAYVNLFMNFYSNRPVSEIPDYATPILVCAGALQLAALLLLLAALVRREFLSEAKNTCLKWSLLLEASAIAGYGFLLRMVSNHAGAANLFFFLGLVYLVLWVVEKRANNQTHNTVFEKVKLLPIILTMCYTMGQPGWNKLFNTSEVMGNYVRMFQESFLASLPGGIPPFIYLLGVCEVAVPLLMLMALVRREFLPLQNRTFLSWAMLVSMTTFIMLAFGLSVLVNYPGATNLIFYAIISLGLWLYMNPLEEK